jgi:uncharacterized DUF497 family protein
MYGRASHILAQAVAGFDWDEGNLTKCQRHGVPVADIESLLSADPRVAPDLKHSAEEDRFVAVGRNPAGGAMFVAFTLRIKAGQWLIRPVSARYMHQKEAQRYEAASP